MRASLLCVIVVALLLAGCAPDDGIDGPAGRIVVGIIAGDVYADGIVGAELSLSELKLRDTSGAWVAVPLDRQSFDLIQLQGTTVGIADASIPARSYTALSAILTEANVMDMNGASNAEILTTTLDADLSLDLANDDVVVVLFTVSATVSPLEPGQYTVSATIDAQAHESPNARIDEEGIVVEN